MNLKSYKGHDIVLTINHQFAVNGPAISNNFFDSMKVAIEEIDKAIKLKFKISREVLGLPALTVKGEAFVIKGINAGTSQLLPDQKNEYGNVYPDVPQLRRLLTERSKLSDRVAAIDGQLNLMRIRTRRGYGRMNEVAHENAIGELKKDYAEAKKNAEKLA